MPSIVGIVDLAPAVDEKCDVFCLSVWNYGNAMKQCSFHNDYGA